MSTLTTHQADKIRHFLADKHIPAGLGTGDEACSIAAINLALNGELTDEIPPCMSPVIGRWIIVAQDSMPDALRNSPEWRELLPLAAGTGRDPKLEARRLGLIVDWMWTCLASVQPVADASGFGSEWAAMCRTRSGTAAEVARAAAERAAAWAAERAAAWAAAAEGAAAAAEGAARAARAEGAAWTAFDPVGFLRRLVDCA